jgi:hypothetical protein
LAISLTTFTDNFGGTGNGSTCEGREFTPPDPLKSPSVVEGAR